MNQFAADGMFTIQQVADMTGLSKQVIRKWEERYGLVQPVRLENRYRVYREADVKLLMRVKRLSEEGHAIKQAILLASQADQLEAPEGTITKPLPDFAEWNEYVLRLLEKGNHCDEIGLNFILKQAYHHSGLERFLTHVVIPFLKEVGDRWENGEWSEYQESVSSLVTRDFLVQIRRNYQYADTAPFVLGACLPFEQHEVPLHIVLLRFMMKGWKTQLIGASPALGAIEALIVKLKPKLVLLSATTTIPFEKEPFLLQQLDQFAAQHREIAFYLGGQGAVTYAHDYKPMAIRITNTIEEVIN